MDLEQEREGGQRRAEAAGLSPGTLKPLWGQHIEKELAKEKEKASLIWKPKERMANGA